MLSSRIVNKKQTVFEDRYRKIGYRNNLNALEKLVLHFDT